MFSAQSIGSPFAKSKGRVEDVSFHPRKPWLFVATQRHVRIYDLASQVKRNPIKHYSCRDGGGAFSPERYRLELNSASNTTNLSKRKLSTTSRYTNRSKRKLSTTSQAR